MSHLPHYEFRRLLETTDVRFQEIADAADVSHTTVYRWKIGKSRPAKGHMRDVLKLMEKKQLDRAKRLSVLWAELDREPTHA